MAFGFKPISNADGALAPYEYLPTSLTNLNLGTALAFSAGKLTKASGTTKPEYICMHEGAVGADEIIPVIRVDHNTVYETSISASGTSLKLGDKVTLATGGNQVTATTTDGVAEIVYMAGTATGSTVRVRF